MLAGLVLLVLCMVGAAHWPVLSAGALSFDDHMYIVDNPLVQNPGWASARRFLSEVLRPSTVVGYPQPLPMISLMLDWAAGGRPHNLTPFHRTSLALHLANTALIIVLLTLLFRRPVAAAAAGLLFGMHPMTIEPVVWITERKTLLATFFLLWGLVLYVLYTRRSARIAYGGSLAATILALLSKPTAIPLPFLLLLLDIWPLNRLRLHPTGGPRPRAVLLEKIPFFSVGAVSAAITVFSQAGDTELTLPIKHPILGAPLVVCHNIIFYLYKIFRPSDLSFYYPFPSPMSLANPTIAAGVAGTLILAALLLLSLRWSRAPLMGSLFFFVAIAPTIGFMGFTFVIASDKYAYLPAVGLLMTLAAFLARLWDWPAARRKQVGVRIGLLAVVVLAAGLEFQQTRRSIAPWRSSEDLFRHMLRHAPDAVPVQFGLAAYLIQAGKTDEALAHLETVLRSNPAHWKALCEAGEIYRKRGLVDKAIDYFQASLRANARYIPALNNLGIAYADQGNYREAIAQYDKTLRIDPGHRSAYLNKGNALNALGRYEEAVAQYDEALRISPNHPRTYYNRAVALRNLGRIDEAIHDFREALRLDPGYASARNQLELTLKEKR